MVPALLYTTTKSVLIPAALQLATVVLILSLLFNAVLAVVVIQTPFITLVSVTVPPPLLPPPPLFHPPPEPLPPDDLEQAVVKINVDKKKVQKSNRMANKIYFQIEIEINKLFIFSANLF